MAADRNITIAAATEQHTETFDQTKKKSGLFGGGGVSGFGGIGITAGSQKGSVSTSLEQTTSSASMIGSVAGNVSVIAGGDVTVSGSDLLAGRAADDLAGVGGNIAIQGKNVTLNPAEETESYSANQSSRSKGLSVAITGTPIDTLRNLQQVKDSDGSSADKASGYAKELGAAALTLPGINVGYGSSKSQGSVAVETTTQRGSSLNAAGNVTVRATEGDITVAGSSIAAGGTATLDAQRHVMLLTSVDTQSDGRSSSSSTHQYGASSISPGDMIRHVQGGPNSGGVRMSPYNSGNSAGNSNQQVIGQTGSTINADKINLVSREGDITLQGAQVAAENALNVLAQKGNVELLPGEISRSWQETQRSKQIGDLGGDGYTGSTGVRNEFHDVNGRQTDQNSVRTSLSSNQGDVNVVAKGDLIARGADISAGNDVTLVGTNVVLDAATDTLTQAERHRVNQAGGTIALSGYGVQAAQAAEAAQRASESGDDRLAALYGAQAGYAAKDAMQGTGAAVKVTVSVGSSSASSNSTLQQSTEQGSTVTAGRNVTVIATGDGTTGADGYAANGDITVRGGQIAAGNSAAFTASRDINFLSSQSSNELDGSSKSGSGSVGVGFGLGGSQNGFTIEIAAAAAQGQMQGNGTAHQATIVHAGNEVGLSSGRDTTLQGAQVIGDTVLGNIGRDLTLSSSQDSQYYDQKDQNGGFGLSLCIPPLCFGASSGSVSYGQTDINNNYNSTTQQTGIAAGAGGYQIHVGNHTQLDGAVIASTADPSKNLLSTESLGITDLSNHGNYSGGSWGGSVGFGGSIGDQSNGGLDPNAPTETRWNSPKASPGLGIPTGDSASSVTRSDISAGTVVVRNGDTSALDGLDRTVTDLQQEGLANKFDPTKVQQDLAAGAMAAELGFKTAGTVAEKMRNSAIEELVAAGNDPEAQKAAQAKIDTWSEGGTGKALLHGLTGALTAALGGGDALDGALGAATVEKAKGAMASYLGSIGVDPSSPLYDLIMEAGSLALGGVAGGTTGAATGLAGDQFNRQLHPDEVMYLAGRAGEFADRLFNCGNQCTEQQVTEARNRLVREAYAIVDSLAAGKFPENDTEASRFILNGAPTFSWGEAFFENKEGAYSDNSFNKALYGSNTQAFDILTSALLDGGMTESAVRLAYNKQLLEMAGSARGRDGQMMLETLTGDIGGIISVFTGLFQGEYGKAGVSAAMLLIPVKLPFGGATGKVVAEVGEPIGQQAIKQGEQIAEQVAADILSSTPKGTTLPVKGPLPGAGATAGESVAEQAVKQGENAAEQVVKEVAEAAKNSPVPRTIDQLLPTGRVPAGDDFARWFDDLTVEELNMLWQNTTVRKAIERRIRAPGRLHEWCMVCRAPTFKEWGVPMDEIQRFRTATKELEWTVPGTNELGGHGRLGSKRFHDELENLIDNSKSLDEFNIGIIQLRDRWKIDPNLLPPLPKKT